MICFCTIISFQRNLTGILLLAFPGVLICSVLFGYMLQFLGFGADVSIYGLFMIGSLLGSTDPVAVNALLKELGTPLRINMLLEGESLLNDGVSLALALAFRKFYEENPLTPLQMIWNMISLCIGGPLFGLIVGFLFYRWMIKIIKDQVMMVTITFICCFLVFFLCEYPPWNLSGILAIVMASLFLSFQGKMGMVADDMYTVVESVWRFVQFIGESLLFVITGIFVGRRFAVDVQNVPFSTFIYDAFRVLIFFISMNVIRWFMIMIFVPFINHKENKLEYKIGWKDAIVISYSGIRGAFPLIICLTIIQNPAYSSEFKYITSVITVGVIFLGIIFNGLTIKFLIMALRIIQPNHAEQSLKKKINFKIEMENDMSLQQVKSKEELVGANWRIVERLCDSIEDRHADSSFSSGFGPGVGARSFNRLDSMLTQDRREIEGEIRIRVLYYLKSKILKSVKEGQLSSQAGSTLVYACDYSEETALLGFHLWKNLEFIMRDDWIVWLMEKFQNYPKVAMHLQSAFTVRKCTHFECVYYLRKLLDKASHNKESIVPVGQGMLRTLEVELAKTMEELDAHIARLNDQDMGLFRLYQTKRAAKEIVFERIAVLKSFYKEGLLSKEVS